MSVEENEASMNVDLLEGFTEVKTGAEDEGGSPDSSSYPDGPPASPVIGDADEETGVTV